MLREFERLQHHTVIHMATKIGHRRKKIPQVKTEGLQQTYFNDKNGITLEYFNLRIKHCQQVNSYVRMVKYHRNMLQFNFNCNILS
jgi:hypothetical protein